MEKFIIIKDASFFCFSDFFPCKIFHGQLGDHGKKTGKTLLHIKDVSAAKQMLKGSHGTL